MFLNLPVLSPDVPAVLNIAPAGEQQLRLALAMSEMGMITDEHLARLDETELTSKAIYDQIERGWQHAIGNAFDFNLIAVEAKLVLPQDDDPRFISEDDKPLLGVVISGGGVGNCITIGKVVTALEDLLPGLGVSVCFHIDTVLQHFGYNYTPTGAFWMAQNCYWGGYENEEGLKEEWGVEEFANMDVPRREEVFDGIPEWAYTGDAVGHKLLSPEEFTSAVERFADHPLGQLLIGANQLALLNKTAWSADGCFDGDFYTNEPPIACIWSENDRLTRIFDDSYNMFMENDEMCPVAADILFRPTSSDISKALPRICNTASVLRALDEVMLEIRRLDDAL